MTRPAYSPAWWLPGAHARTIWGKFFRRKQAVATRTERWDTSDGDFLDVIRLEAPPGRPRLLFLHGLEGTAQSHYATGLFEQARKRGWAADLLIFRTCGQEMNRARRFYHSGETADLDFVLRRLLGESPDTPVVLAGVSLGGNVLLKWLGEQQGSVPSQIRGAAVVSVPFDLASSARRIDQGFSRVYQAHFLRSLKTKALDKLARFPDLASRDRILAARTLYEFDDAVTAPVHGFADADDYYARSSSIRWLDKIRIPTLLLSAVDDPFLPPSVLTDVAAVAAANPCLTTEFPLRGGHVGFIGGPHPGAAFFYAEWRVAEFLAATLSREARARGC
jgi:predicted alpha/beta-fold hydrolase